MAQHDNPGCLFAIFKLFGLKGVAAKALPYRLRDDFLSPAEFAFYHALSAALDGSAIIAPKVNLGDLFFVVSPKENYAFRGRISQKHVDFLLCDPQSMRPLAGIELDDASHGRASRQERDAFVDQVFHAAGLSLGHVICRREYELSDIRALLAEIMGNNTGTQPDANVKTVPADYPARDHAAEKSPEVQSAPVCPKCGVTMVYRQSAHGPFYGCRNFPRCRQTRKTD